MSFVIGLHKSSVYIIKFVRVVNCDNYKFTGSLESSTARLT